MNAQYPHPPIRRETIYPGAPVSGSRFSIVALFLTLSATLLSAQSEWTRRYPMPTTDTLNQVLSIGDKFVAVGTGGTIITSTNGVEWSQAESGVNHEIKSMVWTGSLLVAVGDAGAILTSPDGIAWTRRDSKVAHSLEQVAWTGKIMVAVGQADDSDRYNGIVTSVDGVAWTLVDPRFYPRGAKVFWTGEKIVVFGFGATMTSADGITWSDWIPWKDGDQFSTLLWNGKMFVWNNHDPEEIKTSTDGIIWTIQNDSTVIIPYLSPYWTGTQFLGFDDKSEYSSPDGLHWSKLGEIPGNKPNLGRLAKSIIRSGKQYIAVGAAGLLATSADGLDWKIGSGALFGRMGAIAQGGGKWLAFDNGRNTLSSTDGVSWVPELGTLDGIPENARINSALWLGDRFLVAGSLPNPNEDYASHPQPFGFFGFSPDGTRWESKLADTAIGAVKSVAYSGSKFAAITELGLYTSPDAESWSKVGGNILIIYGSIQWCGDLFMAVGTILTYHMAGESFTYAMLVETSPDGIDWTADTLGAGGLKALACSNHGYVATMDYGGIISSPDARTWTKPSSIATQSLNAVTWTGTQFVAVGGNGAVLSSPDGTDWTAQASGTTANFWNVIAAGGRIAAIADGGQLLTSSDDLTIAVRAKPRAETGMHIRVTPSGLIFALTAVMRGKEMTATLFDLSGRAVASKRVQTSTGKEGRLPLGPLARGRYLLELKSAGECFTQPVAVIR